MYDLDQLIDEGDEVKLAIFMWLKQYRPTGRRLNTNHTLQDLCDTISRDLKGDVVPPDVLTHIATDLGYTIEGNYINIQESAFRGLLYKIDKDIRHARRMARRLVCQGEPADDPD